MGENAWNEPTFACRCEGVTLEAVAGALAAGAVSLNDVKRRTRAGMGMCQGIYCMPAIAALVAHATSQQIGLMEPMTARPPVRPVSLDALAGIRHSQRESDERELGDTHGR